MGLLDFTLAASDPNNPNASIGTPEEIARRRATADALAKAGSDYSPVASKWQGAARMGQSLLGALQTYQADNKEKAGKADFQSLIAKALGGGGDLSAAQGAAATHPASVNSLPAFASGLSSKPSAEIASLLNNSATKYGVDPNTLTQIAGIESKFNPSASNPRSSAKGLFQFIDGTARQYGLSNPFDPSASADAGARLAADNQKALAGALGRAPTPGEVYLAHQQGAGGAIKLLTNPNAPAASLVGANAVRLNGGSSDMTAGEFANKWTSKLNNGAPPNALAYAGPANMAPAQAAIAAASKSVPPTLQGGGANLSALPDSAVKPMGAAPLGQEPQAAAKPQGISVPGYDGVFTRDQSNDGDGIPSQAEWDAASKTLATPNAQVASASPIAAAAAAPVAKPVVPTSAPPIQSASPFGKPSAQQLLAIMQHPYATPAMQQVASTLLQNQMKSDAYSQPYKDANGNYVQRGADGKISVINNAKDAVTSGEANKVIGAGGALVGPNGEVKYKNDSGQNHSKDMIESLADRAIKGDSSWKVGLARESSLITKVEEEVAKRAKNAGASNADEILQNRANQEGRKAGQRTLNQISERNKVFGATVAASIDTAIDASRQVPRSSWLPLNQLMQMGQRAQQDPKYAALVAATNTTVNEYAKAVNPSGVSTDADKAHARDMLSAAQSPEAYETVLRMMHREVQNAHKGIDWAIHQSQSGGKGDLPAISVPAVAPGSQSKGVFDSLKEIATRPFTSEKPATAKRFKYDANGELIPQ